VKLVTSILRNFLGSCTVRGMLDAILYILDFIGSNMAAKPNEDQY